MKMDWKVKRRRNFNTDSNGDTIEDSNNQKQKLRESRSHFSFQNSSQFWFLSLTILVLCHVLTPAHCFFFPSSLFRRLSSPPSPAPIPQTLQGQETLIGSEQQIQPAVRIVNRPNPYQNQQSNGNPNQPQNPFQNQQQNSYQNQQPRPYQNQQQNPSFHVPKALCIACERFPWMPVSGPENPGGQAQPSQQQPKHVQQPQVNDGQPTKTIVISALGQAKGPVPPPPPSANRKPFAIQFESSQTQNNVGGTQSKPSTGYAPNNDNKNPDPVSRPISFHIYDPPRQPTVLKPVGNSINPPPQQQSHAQGYPQQPSPFMQPPPSPGFQFQQVPQNNFRPDIRIPLMSYGRPTILRPVGNSYLPPPPPRENNYAQQNDKGGQNSQQGNQNNQPTNSNNSPIPPITISTIVAAQHGRQQNTGQLMEFNGIQPATLVYQEHSQIHEPSIAPYKNPPQIQYGRPPPPPPQQQRPQNIKLPILQRPFGPNPPRQNVQPQGQYGPPQGQNGPPQGQSGPPPEHNRPPQGQNGPPQGQTGASLKQNGPPQGHYGVPQLQNGPPPGQYRPQQGQQNPPPGSYLPPPQQNRPPPGAYLPPQSQQGPPQKPINNQNILNLRPPPPQGQSSGHVFFPRPVAEIQYGVPRPQDASNRNPNQIAGNQQYQFVGSSSIQVGQTGPNPDSINYRQPQTRPQTDSQSSQTHSSNVVPIPVPNPVSNDGPIEYYPSGSNVQNQQQNPSNNFVLSPNKLSFSPPKGVVKNPHIQSIENLKHPEPPRESNQPSVIPLTQQSSWEIIPAVQTDITHLFKNPQPTQPIEQPTAVTVPVPLPVPIPIPESHASKSPLFIVRGQGNRSPSSADGQFQNGKIVVQGVTYHEENRNTGGEERAPPAAQSQTQQAIVTAPPTIPYQTQAPENPRVTLAIPMIQPQIVLRPHPGHQFDPLPASISTALYHAQRTSYLTHQYLSQSGDKTVYVNSVPVHQEAQDTRTNYIENTNYEQQSDSNSTHTPDQQLTGNGESVQNPNNIGDQLSANCQNHQQWVNTDGRNNEQGESTPQEQSTPTVSPSNADSSQTVNDQKPYLVYYPTPVQQSSIYWVQPPQSSSSGGFLRLRPQAQPPTNEGEFKESSSSPVFSPPLREWSPKMISQTHSVSEVQKINEEAQNNDNRQEAQHESESEEAERDAEEYSSRIPFGQKLPARTTVTPFDIISVGGKDTNEDEARVQSLEQSQDDSNPSSPEYQPRNPSTGSGSEETGENSYQESDISQESNKNVGENHLNEFTSGSQDLDQQQPTAVIRPVSTTIIHSPETKFETHSFRFPSFRPQKVIVHDFTKTGDGVSSFIKEQQQEELDVGQQSQNVQSWRAFNNRPKSPKLVENYPVNENEEEKQSLSSKIVQQTVNKAEVASGSITTAECATAHTEPLTVTTATVEGNPQTFPTGGLAENSVKNGEERDKIRIRVGSRFPAGRPAVTSFNPWSATATTTTVQPLEKEPSSSDDNDSQNPGSYSASISIPVYRPPNSAREIQIHSRPRNSFSPLNNLLNLDDIYKSSEMKQHSLESDNSQSTSTEENSSQPSSTEVGITTMSTEKSSSFSISVDERMVQGENVEFDANNPRKFPQSNEGQKVELRDSEISQNSNQRQQYVHIVTSAPAESSDYHDVDLITTTTTTTSTTTPSPANTSTKIVKTVRVRQRMRPGGGNFNGTIRNRFHGPGRIRVIQRPVTPDYVKHFPEFANQHGDKLGKEEEEEVKNALIELKRSERAKA